MASDKIELPNAFVGRTTPPDGADLAAAMGDSFPVWNRFLGQLDADLDAKILEWRCYSPKWGWALRVKRRKRTIVWLGPANGAFNVTFVLGDKAVRAAQTAGLSRALLKKVNEAKKYPEGRAVRFVMRSKRGLPSLMQIARIKVAN